MFGIKKRPDPVAIRLAKLESVLDRKTPVNSLDALSSAMRPKAKEANDLNKIAFGLDSSVFLKLGSHKQSADIVDYLDTRHSGPLILPGQAVQEFWNNQLAAVETVATGLKKKFDALKLDASKVDVNFGDYSEKMQSLLDSFSSEYGYVYDEATLRSTSNILDVLKKKAFLSYVPRTRFSDIAITRKRTKTPPGFKDDGDGDFYIWIEFLGGLMQAKDSGQNFQHAVILTNDQKIDWSRAGIAHPVLTAEVAKLVDVTFEVWTVDQFYAAITK
jgi:hypothetical protein